MHIIQKKILETLTFHEIVRFAALRPAKIESNLYSYHLKLLIKEGYVKKTEQGYTLDTKGLMYVDHVRSDNFELREQPKIITILVIENKKGEILLWRRNKQPFINTWSLPSGKVHIDDPSIEFAALREAHEKIGLDIIKPKHVGDCYIKHKKEEKIISSVFGHVFYARVEDHISPHILWWKKGDRLIPATEELISLARKYRTNGRFFSELLTNS